ncbi:MAG: hypothetical protein NC321_05845 [Clostridium sp.]|nr:hypothetical protein [Clostridium sp.]
MKKLNKILATMFALALIFALPSQTMTAHAQGFTGPGGEYEGGEGSGKSIEDFFKDSGSTSSSSSSSGSSSSGSSDSGSYYSAPSSDSGSSYDAPSYDGGSSSSDNGGSSSSAPARSANDVTMNVTGGQKFRVVMNFNHTYYEVYHCGISKATFSVADKDGNPVYYKNITVTQGDDGLWYLDIVFADEVDTTGYVVGLSKGDASYLSTELGVSGIRIAGSVVFSTAPAPATVEEVSSEPIATRVCNCGHTMNIYTYGLSADEKAAWNEHMKEHLAKGEATNYSDN